MSRGPQVEGFDYVTGKPVAMTPAEWRAKYPPGKYARDTAIAGETAYWLAVTGAKVAEAYAIIPKGAHAKAQ